MRTTMALPKSARFLATDIWDTPEDGNRYEVIDGNLYVTPPPVPEHQGALGELYGYLWAYLKERPIGRVFFAPIGVVLDDRNGVQPDLVYLSHERMQLVGDRAIEGAPDLVVEALSPSTRSRDLGIKKRRYEAAGVSAYWIVDPVQRTLEAFELKDGKYGEAEVYDVNSIFRPALFPGLEIAINDLFR
jgi:Uma2 family endonuclease